MATYPDNIKVFTYKIDNQDKVIANDVNVLYDEVTEVERQLGQGGVAYSNWSSASTFNTNTTNWYANGGLAARLANIEVGVRDISNKIDGGQP